MTYDVHAHCIPPASLDWLERSGPDLGARFIDTPVGTRIRFGDGFTTDDDPLATVDAVPGLDPAQREAILIGNARALLG